jgi:hypothetical protein
MRRPALLPRIAALLALCAGAACSTPCRELGDRICNCVPDGQTRTTCTQSVKARLGEVTATQDQQDYCNRLLGTCPDGAQDPTACQYMETCPGKVACGMAFPQPGSDGCTTSTPTSGEPSAVGDDPAASAAPAASLPSGPPPAG